MNMNAASQNDECLQSVLTTHLKIRLRHLADLANAGFH